LCFSFFQGFGSHWARLTCRGGRLQERAGVESAGNMPEELVIVDYEKVRDGADLTAEVERAFGPGGFGVIGIRNVPGFVEAKKEALSKVHKLAHLPKEELEKLEDEKSMYNAGWSHGKEKLGDKPDFAKGSFYFNPIYDTPGTPEEQEAYPGFFPHNIWPKDAMPELEPAAKGLGSLMFSVLKDLVKHVDAFAAAKTPNYTPILADAVAATEKIKARLLYYFPLNKQTLEEESPDSWIGWHNDSDFFTCLAGDMFVDDESGKEIACPDPKAGLYVEDRNGNDIKVAIPSDCMAVQLGECVTIVTGGCVKATPHCVRGANPGPESTQKVSRVSFPMFVGPKPQFQLKVAEGTSRDFVLQNAMSNKVPELGSRWTEDGQVFGEFQNKTFKAYYDAATK